MQESSGQPHIDQYRSKLYSLYTSNDDNSGTITMICSIGNK